MSAPALTAQQVARSIMRNVDGWYEHQQTYESMTKNQRLLWNAAQRAGFDREVARILRVTRRQGRIH